MLVVDDLIGARWVLCNLVTLAGYAALSAESGEEALRLLASDAPDLVLLDVCMPDMDGFDVLARIRAQERAVPVIMLTAHGKTIDAVRAIRGGAADYVTRPLKNEDLLATIERALAGRALRGQTPSASTPARSASSLWELMGQSIGVQRIVRDIEQVGPTNFPVLITGETGTGKELVARAVHAASTRAAMPFVVVDCGSIAETLLESELFGHEKGAYTGAHHATPGAFESAAGGTIFLDEIGNLPLPTQSALLRVLETRRVRRVGGAAEQPIDFRVVAATNVDLRATIDQQTFRWDLYHRLAGFTIRLPALRERRDDVPFLVTRFLTEATRELGRNITSLSDEAWRCIAQYDWPGNVRELRNRVRRAVLLSDSSESTLTSERFGSLADGLSTDFSTSDARHNPLNAPSGANGSCSCESSANLLASGRSLAELVGELSSELERRLLVQALSDAAGNKALAARRLQIDYKTLHTKLRKHDLTTIHRAEPEPTGAQTIL